MNHFLDGAWILVKILSYGGLLIALIGVAKFGWHFVRLNARAAQGEGNAIPREAWQGKGAKLGLQLLALGAVLQITSMIISMVLPGRH